MQDEPIINLSGAPDYSIKGLPVSPPSSDPTYTPLNDPSPFPIEVNKPIGGSDMTMTEAAPYKTGRFPSVAYGYNNENIYAQNQSGASRIWNAGVNFVNKTGAYILQNAGFIGGALPALAGGIINKIDELGGGEGKVVAGGNAVSLMTDNFLTQIGDAWKEKVQEVNPIYKTDKYTKGNIWQKLCTTSWWLDDATDRAALTGAMLIPGMLESQGLFGLAGIVMREGGAIEASGAIPRLAKFLADNPKWYGVIGKALGSKVYKAAATGVVDESTAAALAFKTAVKSAQNVEITTFNVIGQNALNGRESQTAIAKSLTEQREKGLNTYTDDDIKEMAAEGARASFWYNMPLTLLSSAWEMPQVFASMRGATNLLKKVVGSRTSEELEQGIAKVIGEKSAPSLWNLAWKIPVTGAEHGHLESSQVAVARYVEEAIAGKMVDGRLEKKGEGKDFNPWNLSDAMTGSFREFINNYSDPNGLNNLALGTIQGMLTTIFGRTFKGFTGEYAKQDKANDNLLRGMNEALASRRYFNPISDMAEKDEDGNVITTIDNDGTQHIKFDQTKLAQLGVSYIDAIKNYGDRLIALSQGDKVSIDKMGFNSLRSLAANFFQDAHGKEYLTNVLKWEAKQQNQNIERENDVNGTQEETPNTKLQEGLDYIDHLYKIYNAIDQRHAGFLNLKVNYKDKAEAALAQEFTENYKTLQYNNGADQIFYNNRIAKNEAELAGVTEKSTDDGVLTKRNNDLLDQNEILKSKLEIAKEEYKNSIDRDKINEAWKGMKEKVIKDKETLDVIKENTNTPTIPEEQQPTVDLETARGKQKATVGKIYFLGSVVDYDKNGLEKPIEIPEFKIIKDNDDGTIDVLTNKNEIKTIKKDVFKDHYISDLSVLKDNDNANYFYQHRNEKFQFNFGKDKDGNQKLVPGRIEYKDGKLFFVYQKYLDRKTGKPILAHIEVSRDKFSAQGDFRKPMIEMIGKVKSPAQIDAQTRLTDAKKIVDENKKLEENVRARNNLLTELHKDLIKQQEDIKLNIEKTKAELKNAITSLTLSKESLEHPTAIDKRFREKKFKETMAPYIAAVNRFSKLKEKHEGDLANLEQQEKNIELSIAYVEDASHYSSELSPDIEGFTKDVEDQLALLEETKKENHNQIGILQRFLTGLNNTIDKIFEALRSFISEFETKYPKAPNAILGQEWVDFIQANPNFLKLKPNYKEDLKTLEDIIAETEEFEITPKEVYREKIQDELLSLEKELKELDAQTGALKTILDKFKPYAEKAKQDRIEEEKINKDPKTTLAAEQEMNSNKAGVRNANLNIEDDKEYEPDAKKPDKLAVTGTIAPDDGKAHQARANLFGARLAKFDNRDRIRGVYVTSQNEHLIAPGLTNFLFPKTEDETEEQAKEKQADIIALVMVEVDDKTGKYTPVDVDGKPIDDIKDALEKGIFQVFPESKLRWSGDHGSESMFRNTTPDEVQKSLRSEYQTWRDGVFKSTEGMEANEDLMSVAHKIEASFGIPSYIRKDNNSIDYSTRTSVEDAGLIDENDMHNHVVLEIPTVNDVIENGSTMFTKAKGRVFAKLGNGYARLNNRQLNEKEATAVYKVIHRLSQLMIEKNGMKSDEAQRLLTYLRSVVFWRLPEKGESEYLGRNNIYFKRDSKTQELTLYVSDDGTIYTFKPSALEENKAAVIKSLQSLFMNINNHMIKDINESYEEIVDINDKGEIKSTPWENYQTYLLSKKNRTADEVPLTTWMKPVNDESDTNRHGIYFYVEDDGESPVVPDYTKQTKQTKKTLSFKKTEKKAEEPEEIKGERTEEESKKAAAKSVKWAILQDILEKNNKPAVKESNKEEFTVGELEEPEGYILNLDRKKGTGTVNIFTTKEGRKVRFVAQSDVDEKNYMTAIGIAPDGKIGQYKEIEQMYIDAGKKINKKSVKEETNDEEGFTVEELTKDDNEANNILDKYVDGDVPEDDELTRQIKEGEIVNDVEDWNKMGEWLKENYPNIPVYRLQNIIKTTKGARAWGMLKKGAIYIFKNAKAGTISHEVVESIWKSLSLEERNSLFNEFKNREGNFYDIASNKNVKHSDATIKQAKERIADELHDYIHEKKIPPKPKDGRPFILKLFSDIVNFFKTFFTGKNADLNLEQLFQRINKGYYKDLISESEDSFVKKGFIDMERELGEENDEYRLEGLGDRQRADVVDQMTYLLLKQLVDKDENLFTIPEIDKNKLYPELKTKIFAGLKVLKNSKMKLLKSLLDNDEITNEDYNQRNADINRTIINIEKEWNTITEKYEEHLKSYSIEFDDNDHIQLNDSEKSKDEPFGDARRIDSFRKANAAIKLLLATIPKTTIDTAGKTQAIKTSINGVSLIPVAQTTISLWNKLANAPNIDSMMEKLREMAKDDSNYRVLYKRLMKTEVDSPSNHSFEKINTTHGSQLINAFWNTFKKQNPSVQNVFILDNGEVVVGDAALSTAAMQFRDTYEDSIVKKAKEGKGFFKWDKKSKKFLGDPIKMRGIVLDSPQAMLSFLNKLGIEFTGKEINYLRVNHPSVYSTFKEAVGGIRSSIINSDEIATLGGKTLEIKKRLLELGVAKSVASNPSFDSTFFNVVGERMQSYIGPNAASDLYDTLSNIKNKKELEGTQYAYLLTDSFAQGSNIMKQLFDDNGDVRQSGKELLKGGWAGGMMYTKTGKSKETSRLTYMERLINELNLNLKGWYLNLVPGDASIEWMLNMGNPISIKSLRKGMDDVHKIFSQYFISEFNTAKDETRNVSTKRKDLANELRFFKKILPEKLYNDIMKQEGDGEQVYNANKEAINSAVEKYITLNKDKTKRVLTNMGVLNEDEKGFTIKNVNLPTHMTEKEIDNELTALTINYMIANTEMHKILYSDPYQYDDELKRIKSFLSPRQSIISGSESMNKVLNKVWNRGFKKGDIGYTNFLQDYFRTATLSDIKAIINLPNYDAYEETDGSGIITFKAYRQFRIRLGQWNDKEENQFRYDMVWEKSQKNVKLTDKEQSLLDKGNPKVQSAYTPLKPIVAGNKANDRDYNDVVLDKYALYPLSYRVMSDINTNGGKDNSNALALYDKMQKENIDYSVFKSGRKVGAEELSSPYDKEGNFNNSSYKGIVNVPFSIMSLQTDVPAKEGNSVTRGSQATKLITMDFMEAGVPLDFMDSKNFEDRYSKWNTLSDEEKEKQSPLFKEIKNNQNILEALMDDGYTTVLNKLGITESTNKNGEKEYNISDFSKAISTLKDEMLKREVNDNLIDALNSFENQSSLLESTPAYQQVRNILYSIVDRLIVSPKMTGGLKVQIPVSFLEQNKIKKIEGKNAYESDTLKFYSKTEDGKKVNVCQMMLSRWFESNKSDKELLDYLNNSEEGKKILRGIAFRIPTQKQNSIDVFEIAQFLPREFGDSVVIPSALVKKAGSDFDIDKLSIYLKNVFVDKNGYPHAVEYLTDENSFVENRYARYIRSKVDNYKSLVREIKEDSIEGRELKASIQTAFEEYRKTLQGEKKTNITDYQEELDKIKNDIDNNEFDTASVYQQGYSIFKELPKSLQQIFYTANDELEKRVKSGEIKNFEKTIEFKLLSTHYLNTLKEDGTYTFSYTKKDGTVVDEEFDGAEAIDILKRLDANYDLFLTMSGWTKEVRDNFYAKLNQLKENQEAFKDLKDTIKNRKLVAPRAGFYKEFDNLMHSIMADVFGLLSLEDFTKLSIYDQNTKEALENSYMESSEALISHPLNYNQLIKPNSAKQLHDLADKIAILLHGKPFDYTEVSNMLDRTFMSRLRHAFISGKQAIAIAAVSQTNHSLNQRQSMIIDSSLLERVSDEDRKWLGDGEVKFSKMNRIKVGNKMLPTLSKITNAAGQHISDIIAQFIDGYVDISKGPWIMELGASPNVAPTFLFLTKLGVPIDDIAYFMNQPLIRHYLNELESNGYSWLFNSDLVDKAKGDIATEDEIDKVSEEERLFRIPSKDVMKQLVGKDLNKLTNQEKKDQLKMLDEFLKYAKMATHLYNVTQAINYDTANFNDPLLIWKKEKQMEKAKKTLISDANILLNNSFVGHIPKVLNDTRNAIAKFLTSDQSKVRNVLQKVLTPYIDMSDNDFLKIARKATADLFDYAVQTDGNFNRYIKELFEGNTVDKIANFVDSIKRDRRNPLHDNYIINTLQISPSPRGTENSINNIKIRGIDNKIYDQNNIIYAFRQLRDELGADSEIYKGLINVAILQSGLSPSKISYTSLIPFEDFANVYSKTLNKIESINLDPFHELGVFYRNNWNNDDIVTRMNAFRLKPKNGKKMYNISMKFLSNPVKEAIEKGDIPQAMTIPQANKEANEQYVFYTWNAMEELLTEKDWNDINNRKVGKLSRIFDIQNEMRKKGDFSYMKKSLFEKVIDEEGEPLMRTYKGKSYIVYKAVNAWGDGNRANEFYDIEHPSIIDNGLEKVPFAENSDIIDLFAQPDTKKEKREGYVSPLAIDEEYFKKSPIAKMVKEIDKSEKTVTPIFKEHQSSNYVDRTRVNASADVTIALATNFESLGERATKKAVNDQKKKYISVDANRLEVTKERVNGIVNQLNSANAKTLNIAGNGIYTMKGKYTQQQIDSFTYDLLNQVLNSPNLKTKITSIRSGGQSGFDEAGAKAGIQLEIPTTILAPKGWKFRDINGKDISNEKQFKDRFKELSPKQNTSEQTMKLKQGTFKYSEISSKMLGEMGYSPKEIGDILKRICG